MRLNQFKAHFFTSKAVANFMFILKNHLFFFTRAEQILSYHLLPSTMNKDKVSGVGWGMGWWWGVKQGNFEQRSRNSNVTYILWIHGLHNLYIPSELEVCWLNRYVAFTSIQKSTQESSHYIQICFYNTAVSMGCVVRLYVLYLFMAYFLDLQFILKS